MKTERITLLGSSEFKAFLHAEAEKEKISVSEFVRRRCERAPSEDELILAELTTHLHEAVAEAKQSLAEGLAAVEEALAEVQQHKQEREEPGLAA